MLHISLRDKKRNEWITQKTNATGTEKRIRTQIKLYNYDDHGMRRYRRKCEITNGVIIQRGLKWMEAAQNKEN